MIKSTSTRKDMVFLGNMQFSIAGFLCLFSVKGDNQEGKKQAWVRTQRHGKKLGIILNGIIYIMGKQ